MYTAHDNFATGYGYLYSYIQNLGVSGFAANTHNASRKAGSSVIVQADHLVAELNRLFHRIPNDLQSGVGGWFLAPPVQTRVDSALLALVLS